MSNDANDNTVYGFNEDDADALANMIEMKQEVTNNEHIDNYAEDRNAITDIRLNGNDLQYKKNGSWTTWHTATTCS